MLQVIGTTYLLNTELVPTYNHHAGHICSKEKFLIWYFVAYMAPKEYMWQLTFHASDSRIMKIQLNKDIMRRNNSKLLSLIQVKYVGFFQSKLFWNKFSKKPNFNITIHIMLENTLSIHWNTKNGLSFRWDSYTSVSWSITLSH